MLEPGELLYRCLDCADVQFCVACYAAEGEAHGHLMVLEALTPPKMYWRQLAWCRSVGHIYYYALHHFAGRPLFGVGCDGSLEGLAHRMEHRPVPQSEGPVDGFREWGPWGPLQADGRASAGIHWLTFQGALAMARACGAALRHRLHLPEEARIGICAPNSPQWVCIDMACALYGLVLAPFHQGLSDDHAAGLVRDAELEALVVDAAALPRARRIAARCPDVRHLIAIDEGSDIRRIFDVEEAFGAGEAEAAGESWYVDAAAEAGRWRESSLSGLVAWGVASPAPLTPAPEESLFTIACTSGSTGQPKGVVFMGKTWRKRFCRPVPLSPEVVVSFQPLSFASARSNLYISLVNGGRIGFHEGREIDGIFATFQRFRPSMIISVPRLWNRLYADYQAALALARLQEGVSQEQAEAQVMAGFREMLGGRTQFLLSGGAPIAPAVLAFLERCYGCRVGDGYGITECGSITTEERLKDDVEYRLEDLPSLGYTRADQPYPRGELWVKTDAMADGYLHDGHDVDDSGDGGDGGESSDTDAGSRFVDGWFRTGDIVEERAPRVLRVIDRRAHVIKLAQGVFVSPEQLEQVYQASPLVAQLYLHCDPLRSGILALVVPNAAALAAALGASGEMLAGKDSDAAALSWLQARSEEAALHLRKALSQIADEAGLRSFERPQAVGLVWEPFTVANGMLTSTSKLSRRAIAEQHKERLAAMADAIDTRDQTALRQQIVAIVRGALSGQDDASSMTPPEGDSPNQSLGIDSLAALSIKAELLTRCQIDLPLERLLAADGFDDLMALVSPQGPEASSSVSQTVAALQETLLSLKAQREAWGQAVAGAVAQETDAPDRMILLTGATGFVGPHLLAALLTEHPDATIACLVRASDEAVSTAEARLQEACRRQQVWERISRHRGRWSVVVGDLSQPRLGLADDIYDRLARSLDLIVHNGAWVNHALPYERLRASHVGGTIESLALAASAAARYLFVSSTSAVDRSLWEAGGERLREPVALLGASPSELQVLADSLGGYGVGKAMGELAVTLALEAGVPCQVVRPGYLGGHRSTGACNLSGSMERVMQACWSLRSYPKVPPGAGLNVLPVDVAAEAIAALSSRQRWPYPTLLLGASGDARQRVDEGKSAAPLEVVTHLIHPAERGGGLVTWSSLFAAMAAIAEEVGSDEAEPASTRPEGLRERPYEAWWQEAWAAQQQAVVQGVEAPLVGLLAQWKADLPDQSQRPWPTPKRLLERLPGLSVEGWESHQIAAWVRACLMGG